MNPIFNKIIDEGQQQINAELHGAIDSLRRLQGLYPYNTLDNRVMGCILFAIMIEDRFSIAILEQAREVLDAELGHTDQLIDDPSDLLILTCDCGEAKFDMLTRFSDIQEGFFNIKGTSTGRFPTTHSNDSNQPKAEE